MHYQFLPIRLEREFHTPFQRAGRAALQTQRNHLYKEEVVLFPMVARFLSPDRDALLLRQLQVLPARDFSSQCSEQAR